MPEINEEIAKNIQEFFEMYGPKEFVTIYLQQILRVMISITGSNGARAARLSNGLAHMHQGKKSSLITPGSHAGIILCLLKQKIYWTLKVTGEP